MKISQVIKKLELIKADYGDVELNVYLSYSKETRGVDGIEYDEELKDAYIGVYG